jgi:iron(III) transport system ATP-binding protein
VKRFGARSAVNGVSLDVSRGQVLCLLGASGCGKSTTLRIAAGLERPDAGCVFVGGRLVEGDGVHVPPERRGIGLMFQDYALFPHLSVRGNVGFGLAHLPRAERNRRAERELERVGLGHLADAFPHTLSGGEQQRVALARMLAPAPSVVLMDEPFSGLDTSLRDSVRATTLKTLREANAAVVIVTHDPDEALRIADRIALMRGGRIVQEGTPVELYAHPVDRETAVLFGSANLFHTQVTGRAARSPFGPVPAAGLGEGDWAEVLYRSAQVRVADQGVPARVVGVRPQGGILEVEAAFETAALPEGVEAPPVVRAAAALGTELSAGAPIRLQANPEDAFVFPCLDKGCRA